VSGVARALVPKQARALTRRARLRFVLGRFPDRVVAHDYGGLRLHVWIADPVAEAWYDRDREVLPELALLRQHGLRPGARVFDLGAHHAVIALLLAHEVGEQGSVIAVEALSHNVRAGERNKGLNGATNLTIVHAAAARNTGEVTFSTALNGHVEQDGRFGVERVHAVSLPELCDTFGIPNVVYVDVEGQELEVLRGGERVLRQHQPSLFVEVHVGWGLEEAGGSSAALIELLDVHGYSCFVRRSDDATFRPLDEALECLEERHFLIALPGQRRRP